MIQLINAQFKKTHRTAIQGLSWSLPFLYAVIVFFYFVGRHSHPRVIYSAFFLGFIVCAEFALSILVPMIYAAERSAGNFANELRIGVSRKRLWYSRFGMLVLMLIGIELVAVVTFIGLETIFARHILGINELVYTCLMPLFLIPIIVIYQVMACLFSYTGTLITGIIFTLSAILLGTTDLGNQIWYWLPWTWAVKLLYQGYGQFNIGFRHLYWLMALVAVILTLGELILSSVWYNRWEGISKME